MLQFGIDRKSTRVLTHVGNGNVRASLQMMQATGSVATNFLKSNMVQYQPRVSGYWNTLKVYFTVSEGGGVRRPSYLSCRGYTPTSTPTTMYVKLGETLGWHHGRRYMWASKPYLLTMWCCFVCLSSGRGSAFTAVFWSCVDWSVGTVVEAGLSDQPLFVGGLGLFLHCWISILRRLT